MNVMEDSATNQAKNRSRGVVVFDNAKSLAATRLSQPLSRLVCVELTSRGRSTRLPAAQLAFAPIIRPLDWRPN